MIKKKLFAILMAAFVVASVPVYADYTYNPLVMSGLSDDEKKVIFDTQITGSDGLLLPSINIAYTIQPVSVPNGVSGNINITTTSDNSTDPHIIPYNISTTLDLSGLSFSKPGEYVWSIGVDPNDSTNENSTYPDKKLVGFKPSEDQIYLHVFIEDNATAEHPDLKFGSAYLSTSKISEDKLTIVDGQEPLNHSDNKDDYKTSVLNAATYQYDSCPLTLNVAVAGNMGDKTQKFSYTINLTGCNKDSILQCVNSNNNNGTKNITVPENGSVSIAAENLSHGDSYTISGIPKDAQYEIIPTEVSGYTPKAEKKTN